MESNWRWNVWDLGVDPLVSSLIGRDSMFPNLFAYGNYLPNTLFYMPYFNLGPGLGWVPGSPSGIAPRPPHFPYGINVLPD